MTFYKTNFSKNGIIALILAMLFVFPNLDVYSSLGSYTIESQGLRANERFSVKEKKGYFSVKQWAPAARAIFYGALGSAIWDGAKSVYNNPQSVYDASNYVDNLTGNPVIADYQIKQNYNMVCNGFCQSPSKTYKSNYNTRYFSGFDN